MSAAKWKRGAARLKGKLRRKAEAYFPNADARAYAQWMRSQGERRRNSYNTSPELGLFSILTAVWDGSPVRYLESLAATIEGQNETGHTEWIILDNGCSQPSLRHCFGRLADRRWIKIVPSGVNLGILNGLRRCLEEARGRYVLPVDADDLLYPDALRICSSVILAENYPALLYTDEDKVIGSRMYQPYQKPAWDPVLLLNSAYTAHLGIVDREKALALGAYSDSAVEGSPDWDLFTRFLIAGYAAHHISEIVYSWRVHASSTADDDAVKPYVYSSQRAVLQRFLDSRPAGKLFNLEPSPLFEGGVHWHFRRKPEGLPPFTVLPPSAPRNERESAVKQAQAENGLVAFLNPALTPIYADWQAEAAGLFELHADAALVGGALNIPNSPGYFGQAWKQRSVSELAAEFLIAKPNFLLDFWKTGGEDPFAFARQQNRRMIYSPFLCCRQAGS